MMKSISIGKKTLPKKENLMDLTTGQEAKGNLLIGEKIFQKEKPDGPVKIIVYPSYSLSSSSWLHSMDLFCNGEDFPSLSKPPLQFQ